MQSIDLKTAVTKIYQIVDQRRKLSLPSPFFFIAGAGVSNPPIPLAWEIEEQCKQVAQSYDDTNSPELKTTMDSYSHWLGMAYPSSEGLQRYLRGLMENKPISKANLRLAHLLLDGRLARTVFTPNFDDLLPKALELFGQRPLVCDHPLTVGRIRIESNDIQIIHVHGSYWFYDCCNLRQEIAERAGYGPVSVLLDQSIRDHSPIVVGYSGWDGDILMSALKRRLSVGKLGTPAFWFCYKQESLDALPDWLTQSNEVFFVLPDDPVPATVIPSALQISDLKSEASPRTGSMAGIGDSSRDEKTSTLPANRVLDALVRKFEPASPPLIQNPLAFYADHLKALLGTSDPEGEQDTYYSFHKVIARVERARDSEAVEEPDLLQGFRDAMSKADYRNAIKSAKEIALDRLSLKERSELLFALIDACNGLYDNSDETISGYGLIVRAADLLALDLQALDGQADPRLQWLIAMALFDRGVVLGSLGRSEEAIADYDEVMRHFADAKEPALQVEAAQALVNKGHTLGSLGRSEEAIAVYDDVVSRFADAKEPALRGVAAMALFGRGHTLGSLGRSEEAIVVYDDVVSRFADAKEPALRGVAAGALVSKGVVLGSLGKREEAIAVYDDVMSRFVDAKEPALRERVAIALINKGVQLGTLGRNEEAIAIYDDVVSRFGDDKEPALREKVGTAILYRGMTYESSGNKEIALANYEEVLARFGGDKGSGIESRVNQARNNRDNLRNEGETSA
jgi:tetratricopeptide (TPR) repeat protein